MEHCIGVPDDDNFMTVGASISDMIEMSKSFLTAADSFIKLRKWSDTLMTALLNMYYFPTLLILRGSTVHTEIHY